MHESDDLSPAAAELGQSGLGYPKSSSGFGISQSVSFLGIPFFFSVCV